MLTLLKDRSSVHLDDGRVVLILFVVTHLAQSPLGVLGFVEPVW